MDKGQGKRKTVVGVVTSDKMQKTITVHIERLVKHPRVGKYIKRYTVCKAHDERNQARIGDTVELIQSRPLSKTKRWRLIRILKRSAEPRAEEDIRHDHDEEQA